MTAPAATPDTAIDVDPDAVVPCESKGCDQPAAWVLRLFHFGDSPIGGCGSPLRNACNKHRATTLFAAAVVLRVTRTYRCKDCGTACCEVDDLVRVVHKL